MDINQQIKSVIKSFQELTFNNDKMEFSGELFISEKDSYDVKIVIGQFPNKFPLVYEMGERIPRKIDRHIYPISGNCCLTTTAKEQVLLGTRIKTLREFILLVVIPYFQNNSYYELNRCYKEGEYSHGELGIIEGYQDILTLDNKFQIAMVLEDRIRGENLADSDNCFCGSGLSLRKCKKGLHRKSYNDFKLIDVELLSNDLYKRINPFLREVELYKKMMRK
ncbi:MAG: hypothetical protein R3255_06530 [Candidatus Lokiarchaeia archaeon]|nr:hypothetical protein [Candidatus Lokiarchaeia archaeon]